MIQMKELSNGAFNQMVRLNERVRGVVYAERSSLFARAIYVPFDFRSLAKERPAYFKALMMHEAVHARYRDYFVLWNYLIFTGLLIATFVLFGFVLNASSDISGAIQPEERSSIILFVSVIGILIPVCLFRMHAILHYREFRADRVSYKFLGKDYFVLLEEIWKAERIPRKQKFVLRFPKWITHPSIESRIESLRVHRPNKILYASNLILMAFLVGFFGPFLIHVVTINFTDYFLLTNYELLRDKSSGDIIRAAASVLFSLIGGCILFYFLAAFMDRLFRLQANWRIVGVLCFYGPAILATSIVTLALTLDGDLGFHSSMTSLRLNFLFGFWGGLLLVSGIQFWKRKKGIQLKASFAVVYMSISIISTLFVIFPAAISFEILYEGIPFTAVALCFGIFFDILNIGHLRDD